jgi:hypothetical protein
VRKPCIIVFGDVMQVIAKEAQSEKPKAVTVGNRLDPSRFVLVGVQVFSYTGAHADSYEHPDPYEHPNAYQYAHTDAHADPGHPHVFPGCEHVPERR